MEDKIPSSNATSDKDQMLWNIARKRAQFKKHLFTYLIINVFLWILWWVTRGQYMMREAYFDWTEAWPIWVTIGWGIGLAFNYFEAYQGNKDYITQKEYDKLIKKNSKV